MARSTTVRKTVSKGSKPAGPDAASPTQPPPIQRTLIQTTAIEPRWYVVDAAGKTLGRLSTVVATHLMGKQRPHYTPHQLFGDHVVVLNAGKIKVTGRKLNQKMYRWHTGYPGGLKELPLWKALAEHPLKVIEWAVQGMLPKSKIGKRMIRNLIVYAGPEHPHAAQRPEPLELSPIRKSA